MSYFNNIVKRDSKSKLQIRHASHCHIYRDIIQVFCCKSDKNNVKTEWVEQCPNDMKIHLQYGKSVAYEYLYLNSEYVGFLKDITKIEYYPENNSGLSRELNVNISTIILHTKKGLIKESTYTIQGRKLGGLDMSFLSRNNNEFFKYKSEVK